MQSHCVAIYALPLQFIAAYAIPPRINADYALPPLSCSIHIIAFSSHLVSSPVASHPLRVKSGQSASAAFRFHALPFRCHSSVCHASPMQFGSGLCRLHSLHRHAGQSLRISTSVRALPSLSGTHRSYAFSNRCRAAPILVLSKLFRLSAEPVLSVQCRCCALRICADPSAAVLCHLMSSPCCSVPLHWCSEQFHAVASHVVFSPVDAKPLRITDTQCRFRAAHIAAPHCLLISWHIVSSPCRRDLVPRFAISITGPRSK